MGKARNPTADQRQHFHGLQRGRSSRAEGCKPLSQQVCARHLCSFRQANVLLPSDLPLRSGPTLPRAQCQSHCLGMSHPSCLLGDQGRDIPLVLVSWSLEWGTAGTASTL